MAQSIFLRGCFTALLILCVSGVSADWLPFEGVDGSLPETRMQTQSWDLIAFDVTLKGMDATPMETKGGAHTVLNFAGNAYSGEFGTPRLPVLRKFVEVPFGAEIDLVIESASTVELSLSSVGMPGPLVPVQPPVPKLPGAYEAAPFIKDQELYSKNEWIRNPLVTIRDDDIMRGHRIVVVEISPVAYNPAKHAIEYVTGISIDLRLRNSDIDTTLEQAKRYASYAYNQIFDRILINYGDSKNFAFPPAAPIGYMIIASTDYQSALTPFVEWKEQCGYDVTVVTAPPSATTTTIRNLILDAYNNWTNPPDYVLLAGDTNTIPCYTGEESATADDNQYTELAGTGYWTPDVMIGRFPVRSVTDVENLLNKLLQFEQMTMPSKTYFKDSVWLASTDHADQLEATHEFCYNTYVDPVDPTNNTPYWEYERDGAVTADFASNVNAGRGIVCYSGHGYGDGTGTASIHFVDSNVQALTNVDKYGNVNIFACGTNKHDQTVSFGERWVIVPNKGSISYWGTSNNSYWDEDDWQEREIYRCQYQDSIHTLSASYFYGLIEVYNQSTAENSAYYFDIYNLMGDPSTDLVTRIPQTITISSANSATPNEQDYPVTVTVGGSARAGALVAITMNGSLLGAAYTNASGLATVHMTPPAPGTALITVTGHNLIPQTKNLSIMAAGCGAAALDQIVYTCSQLITMRVWDSDLNTNPSTVNTGTVTIASTTESTPETVTVTETGVNTGEFVGTIQGSSSQSGAGYLRLTHGDTITLHYHDAACEGSPAEVYDTATADCQGPVISNVQVTGITGFTATVTWTTSESSISRVRYGTSTPPGTVSENLAYTTSHSRLITGLTACTLYRFQVEAADVYGNTTVDTNGGSYYSFTTAGSRVALSADMSTNPGWTTTGQWAWGQPTGTSGDPTAGYTGNNVYGYNLAGAYANGIVEYALTTPAINCSAATSVVLDFYRWLGVEDGSFDHARIQVSTNGSTWNLVWENGSDANLIDTAWTNVQYDLTSWAAGQSSVQVRWIMGTADSSVVFGGWNIDDVQVVVEEACGTPTATPTGPTRTPTPTVTVTPTMTPTTGPGSCGGGYTQVTLLNEAFTTWPLTGWTVVNNVGTCGWRAGAGDTGTDEANQTGGSGEYADADSDDCGTGSTTNTELRTPVLNLSGLTNPWLTFKSDMEYYTSGGAEYWHVDVTTNGGASWTTILNRSGTGYPTEMIQLDLTAYQGLATVMIRFHYYGQYDYWWQIDDVLVTACQPTGATATPTRTPTIIPATFTPTRTATPAPTFTPTSSPTVTPVPSTFTPTRTPTATNTPVPNTFTPTRTPTATTTPVPGTFTPTRTPTPIPGTNTPTATSIPGTPTQTPTPPPVPTSGPMGLGIMILAVSLLLLASRSKW